MHSSITQTEIWQKLIQHQKYMATQQLTDLFAQDKQRFHTYSLELESVGLMLDYSRNHINAETLQLLSQFAEQSQLQTWIADLFRGEKINHTENRAALHTALRNRSDQAVYVDGENIMPKINMVLNRIQQFAESVRNGSWRGHSGKAIETIVNIGIGGSDLGPAMVVRALKPYHHERLRSYFVSNVDATHLSEILPKLDPETVLFIVASKTFTTQETMLNARSARSWFLDKVGQDHPEAIASHFVAISTDRNRVVEFGINPDNMFEFWDWVGGRYSLWSAIGLSIVLMIGMDNFKKLLSGAHEMDVHFQTAPFTHNMPVLLALLGIWYNNFFNAHTQVILPYDFALELLPAYLQQLIMESLGKSMTRDGDHVDYATCPIVWGAPGNNGQHAFYQLLHQGTHIVPADFIVAIENDYQKDEHELATLSNVLAQIDALMHGRDGQATQALLQAEKVSPETMAIQLPHRTFPGNRPSNVLVYQRLTPQILGALLALYEHKTFVQGVCWHINPFDQWGVELGKQVADDLLLELKDITHHSDAAISDLLKYVKDRWHQAG